MPAQRRQQYEVTEEESKEAHDEEQPEDVNGFERSPSSSEEEKDEFIVVKLTEIRKEVQCPICLGIIRKTRTVMECLHRFCRECIDKSMRLGNNECPACRTHCASRRSLRDDPNYDALIAALYPDIDKYEEEELAFQEEEKARNKQIQASIAQTILRQTEALGKKKQLARSGTSTARRSKRRKNYRAALGLDESEDLNANEDVKDSSSADEPSTENKPKRSKRLGGARFSLPSSAGTTADGGGDENDTEVNRESLSVSVGFAGSSERLAWGKGGMRSHTRYGSGSAGNGKNARSIRISKLVDYFQNLDENDLEFDINLTLVSFDEQTMPTLARSHLSCRPNLSVADLCRYVAYQTRMQPDEVELLMGEEMGQGHKPDSLKRASTSIPNSVVLKPCHGKLQVLNEHETLGKLRASCNSGRSLLLAYRPKLSA